MKKLRLIALVLQIVLYISFSKAFWKLGKPSLKRVIVLFYYS
ncbi:hypothetical protein [Helicobacter himalayensis]|nr:hypothetical protein [Helicobacter himalayensis]